MAYKITFDGEKYMTSLVNKICQLKGQQKKTYEGETEFDYDMLAEWVRVQVDKLLAFVMHLSMLSPRGGPRAYVGHLTFQKIFWSKSPRWGPKTGSNKIKYPHLADF